jgi:hypothetical protein
MPFVGKTVLAAHLGIALATIAEVESGASAK